MFSRLSVSNLNDFISRRPKWYLTRVKGISLPVGVEAHRGSAVEFGVVRGLVHNTAPDQCAEAALQSYDDLVKDMDVDEAAKCREPIPGLVKTLLDALPGFKALATQKRCEWTFPETGLIPWVGYADVEGETVLLDLKTKGRTPSELPGDWRRQGAAYSKALGKPVRFVCAIPTKVIGVRTFDLTEADVERGIAELRRAAAAMYALLDLSLEAQAAACFPDLDSWLMNDEMFAAAVKETWKL